LVHQGLVVADENRLAAEAGAHMMILGEVRGLGFLGYQGLGEDLDHPGRLEVDHHFLVGQHPAAK
jgi:hypothetical protein